MKSRTRRMLARRRRKRRIPQLTEVSIPWSELKIVIHDGWNPTYIEYESPWPKAPERPALGFEQAVHELYERLCKSRPSAIAYEGVEIIWDKP